VNIETSFDIAKRSVVRAGGGRGFVVGSGENRYVITAAHCLPHQPADVHLDHGSEEHIYSSFLGSLGSTETIGAELVALCAIDDVAVFYEPDGQDFYSDYTKYAELTVHALSLGKPPKASLTPQDGAEYYASAWVLSLDCEWQNCTVRNTGRMLSVTSGTNGLIFGGMSGSPIINDAGAVIGVVSMTSSSDLNWQPSVSDCLPPWLLRKLD
jgi:hypothetical protein